MPTLSTLPITPPSPLLSLSDDDREHLYVCVHRGYTSARTRIRAQVLLKLGEGWSEAEVCRAFDVCLNTVKRVRHHFAEGGVEAVLTDKRQERRRQERRRQALSGTQQAHLIALACSAVPEGHDHWTLRLLAGQAVELGYVTRISPETIRALLRRTTSSRGSIVSGVSRP
ncbi:MAG: helix-turn-helix domain-containing protein [Ktedonobacterales bacterium]